MPIVVMIHGMWGGPWYWEPYRRLFESAGYRCIAVTLPHHDANGRVTPDPKLGTTSLLDYAAAIERDLDALDEKPILVGHSMGGLLAQMLAARGRAEALVLLTPAAPAGVLALTPSVIRSFWSITSRWGFWKKPTLQTFDEAVYSMLHLVPPAGRRAIYDRFVHESGRATFETGYWLLDRRHASSVDASKVTCPVLVVAGAQDRITPASVVRKVAKRYAASYREFADHAHWVVGEPGWEDVAGFVLQWLEAQGWRGSHEASPTTPSVRATPEPTS